MADDLIFPLDLGDLPQRIGYALRRAQLAVFKDFIETCAVEDVRPAQFSALTIIARNPGLKQSDVAQALGVKRTNFVAFIGELERRGLVRRAPGRHDGRTYALHLTPEGTSLLDAVERRVAIHEARMTQRVGAQDRDRLLTLLGRLAREE